MQHFFIFILLLINSFGFLPKIRNINRRPSKISSSEYFENICIRNWAVFEEFSLNLSGKPQFTVITGETGSGKSLMIKALEYCVGKNKKSPLYLFDNDDDNCEKSSQSDIKFEIFIKPNTINSKSGYLRNEIPEFILFKRTINPISKKSFVEIDGKKSSIKLFQTKLSELIRFWPDRDNYNTVSIENQKTFYLNYIDRILETKSSDIMWKVKNSYAVWQENCNLLRNLDHIKEKVNKSNELELTNFYIEEYDQFNKKLMKIVEELKDFLFLLYSSRFLSDLTNTQNNVNESSISIDIISAKIDEVLKETVSNEQNKLKLTKEVFHEAESFLRIVFSVFLNPNNNGGVASKTLFDNSKQNRLKKIIIDLDAYYKDFEVTFYHIFF